MTYESNRRDFLKTGAAVGAVAGAAGGATVVAPADAQVVAKAPQTKVVKSVCHQCPARCGIDVSVTDGKVHSIFGSLNHPMSNGKLCPKGHLGQYILYDPDRFAGPMKRTNPKKGRNEDPKFVQISWDEALDIIAKRLQTLRDKNEQHRFALVTGRGWGQSDAGLTAEQASRCLDLAEIRSADGSFVHAVRALGVEHPLPDEGLDELLQVVTGAAGAAGVKVPEYIELVARG